MMMSVEQSVKWLEGETEVLEMKPGPVPLYTPQILQYLSRARTRATAAVGSQRLTAWAMSRS
jgi:hypothetical protein